MSSSSWLLVGGLLLHYSMAEKQKEKQACAKRRYMCERDQKKEADLLGNSQLPQ
jgi:hypothetical protein